MAAEEKILVEKIDGTIVTIPSEGLSFYIHEVVSPITGRATTEVTPLMLPEARLREFIESVREAIRRKPEIAKEVI
ncbi:MAG: hypothetical protein ACUVTD_08755 [Nitrososphaerales archaeon]